MARAVVSPIYTSGAYSVRYLPYSIFDSGMHPAPIPAVIEEETSNLLAPFNMHTSGKPANALDDKKSASLLPENIDNISASFDTLVEPAVRTEVEELNEVAAVRIWNRVADKHEPLRKFDLSSEQAGLQQGILMRAGNRMDAQAVVQGGMERFSAREADTNTYQSANKEALHSSHDYTPYGTVISLCGIDSFNQLISTQYFNIRPAWFNELAGYKYLGSRTASYSRHFAATVTKFGGTSIKQPNLVDRDAARDIDSLSIGSGKRLSSSGDKFSISTGDRNTSNAFMQERERGLGRVVLRADVTSTDRIPAVRSSIGFAVKHLSIPSARLYKKACGVYSVIKLSKLLSNAVYQSDIISVNTTAYRSTELDAMVGMQIEASSGEALNGIHANTTVHTGTELDNIVDAQTNAQMAEVSDSIAFAKQSRKTDNTNIEQTDIVFNDAIQHQITASEHTRHDIEHLCTPKGLFWDELWDDLYRDYSERVDRLQLPPVDFKYDTALLYDPKTGEPYKPLSPADVPEVMVEFPASHPVGKYADVGLKIVNVHLWVLRDVMLLLYRDLKENTFSYEKLPPGEAIRVAIDRLYNKLRQFDYKREEYQRVFRMVRWYGEYVIVSTNNYFLVREYEPWISHESSLDLEGGIPKEDKPYIVRADGWEVDRVRQVYVTRTRDAALELSVSNLLPTVFEFTVEIINNSGTASAKLTIDGRDKSYLLASLARAEADLPKGQHTILFEFHTESEDDRMELSGMKVDYVKFRSAQVIESPKNVNGYEAVDMLIGMLKRYYDLHHEGKVKGTRLFNLGKKPRLGR